VTGDFEAFATTHLPSLLRFGHLLTGDQAAAEDLVQIALARTSMHWSRLREPAAAPAYVRRAMVRQHSNVVRRLLSRERVGDVPDRVEPDSAYQHVDERDAMWAALATLAPRQRAVLVLRYYEQLSEAEIAAALGCSNGTVKSQASKGLAKLRAVLSAADVEVEP
jgi:RNA polymerase sigma-70 factor (sigma-E family)